MSLPPKDREKTRNLTQKNAKGPPARLVRFFSVFSRKISRRFAQGFTLVEVLIAIVILAGGLVLVLQGMGMTEQALRASSNLVTASQLAEEGLAQSELEIRQAHELGFGLQEGRQKLPGREFGWVKQTGPYEHESLEDKTKMNEVQVRVNWKEGPAAKDLELSSLLLNREKQQ